MPNNTSIIKAFSSVEDPRIDRTKKHKLIDIITISLCSIICGSEGWEDIEFFGNERREWFETFLDIPNGIPSHDTIRRVFERIDTRQFNDCLVEWTKSLHEDTEGKIIAIDGKTIRHSFDKATGKAALHLVSAWVHDSNIMLGQCAVDTKKNEISIIPNLLKMLEISGAIVTIDAIGCQKEFARTITEDNNADYVLAVKANQPNLLKEVEEMFQALDGESDHGLTSDFFRSVDGGHGRVETRLCTCIDINPWTHVFSDKWSGIQTIARIHSQREIGEKDETQTRYFISSLPCNAELIARAIRGHWGIENSMHWVLDVVFSEDDLRIRKANSPENLAVIRRAALNMIKLNKPKGLSVRKARMKAMMNCKFAERLITGN